MANNWQKIKADSGLSLKTDSGKVLNSKCESPKVEEALSTNIEKPGPKTPEIMAFSAKNTNTPPEMSRSQGTVGSHPKGLR